MVMIEALRKVIKRMHYPLEVMLTCVRWYAAYPLSLRHIEEMMAERGVFVDHATVHRWAIKILPILAAVFRRHKRPVGTHWCFLLRAHQLANNHHTPLRFDWPLPIRNWPVSYTAAARRVRKYSRCASSSCDVGPGRGQSIRWACKIMLFKAWCSVPAA